MAKSFWIVIIQAERKMRKDTETYALLDIWIALRDFSYELEDSSVNRQMENTAVLLAVQLANELLKKLS